MLLNLPSKPDKLWDVQSTGYITEVLVLCVLSSICRDVAVKKKVFLPVLKKKKL